LEEENMGLKVEIPGREPLTIEHLVLDLNGTLALDGMLLPGVEESIREVSKVLDVYILTADTHGTGQEVARRLGVELHRLEPENGAMQKGEFVQALGPEHTAAIGNGVNDVEMLSKAALGIAVVGPEGAASRALLAAVIVVSSPVDAFSMLLNPKRITATLRE
jgi:P-type E1-E2 ATPase